MRAMSGRRLFQQLAMIAWACLAAAPASAATDDPAGRVARVELWLKAVFEHRPGETDESSRMVAAWSSAELRTLNVDQAVFVQLLRNPFERTLRLPMPASRSTGTAPRTSLPRFPYTDWQIHRLRVLACVARGDLDRSTCARMTANEDLDADLRALSHAAHGSHERGDDNYILRHGALLHTIAAISSTGSLEPLDGDSARGQGKVVVQFADGRETNIGRGAIHWDMARLLLDAVSPAPDDMTRRWYIATAAWMQHEEQHDTKHLLRAREMFPSDPDILFLSGCQQETYASPAVQTVVRTAVLPDGVLLDVQPEARALRDAEAFFRRALMIAPDRDEARLRLGHVLLARGRAREALDELERATTLDGEPPLGYYAALFRGAAEEALGHFAAAQSSYARAAGLSPAAQAPYLALSQLAMRSGNRAGAVKALEPMLARPVEQPDPDDPWWLYSVSQARHADTMLERLFQSVEAAER